MTSAAINVATALEKSPMTRGLLKDHTVPLESRLNTFYRDYYDTLLTRQWLRLFLYSSLEDLQLAPTYTSADVHERRRDARARAASPRGDTGRLLQADAARSCKRFRLQSPIACASGCRFACPRISRASAMSTTTIVKPTKSSVAR